MNTTSPAAALFAGLRLPVIAAPMFLVSGPDLVIAACKAGIIGAFPALNARPESELDPWLTRIDASLAAHRAQHPDARIGPHAVNLIVNPANKRLAHDLDVCVAHRVPVVITSLHAPTEVVERVHGYGGVVLHDVVKVRHAEKALEAGVDGIILVCAGAGGHAGRLNPFALVNEMRRFYAGPLVLAGAITNGSSVLAVRAMGCDAAYMGTRFIATRESLASESYKQMVLDSNAEDIVYTPFFSGVHASYLKPSVRAAGLDPDALAVDAAGKAQYRSREEQPKAWKDVWGAGQGVGNIDRIVPTQDLVASIAREYDDARVALLGHA